MLARTVRGCNSLRQQVHNEASPELPMRILPQITYREGFVILICQSIVLINMGSLLVARPNG